MNILIVHRSGEIDTHIKIAKKFLHNIFLTGFPGRKDEAMQGGWSCNISAMVDDKKTYFTGHTQTWLRSCATGYNAEGNPRYTAFVLVGKYLDEDCRTVLRMAQEKPCYVLTEGKLHSLEGWTSPNKSDMSIVKISEVAA